MMERNELQLKQILELKKVMYAFGDIPCRAKQELLSKYSKINIRNTKVLIQYQEILLFIAAYPDSSATHKLAEEEIKRVNRIAASIMNGKSERIKIALSGSGFASTYFIGSFSHTMCTWLLQNFPDCTSFHSIDDSTFSPQEVLQLSLLTAETWLKENSDLPLNKWLMSAFKTKEEDSLKNLLDALSFEGLPTNVRDLLFDSFKLFISFDIKDESNALSLLRVPRGKIFYHQNELVKKVDLKKILNKKLTASALLKSFEKEDVLRVSRFALLHLSRETDTVTYAEPAGTELHELDRGLSVALFHLPTERRNAMDAYVGYMAFKNKIPCAYGGAWIFGKKAKIGLNIFPSFRGGESSFLFSQIMRLYRNKFNVRYFEAEPYQIGKDNPEGVTTGAFWFYYKLGFRPYQHNLNVLASDEFEKIKTDRSYRTQLTTLRKLANSFLFLDSENPGDGMKTELPDSLKLSKKISECIAKDFSGDRNAAMSYMKKHFSVSRSSFKSERETEMYHTLLPFLYILQKENSNFKLKQSQIVKLVRSRFANTEFSYTQELLRLLK